MPKHMMGFLVIYLGEEEKIYASGDVNEGVD